MATSPNLPGGQSFFDSLGTFLEHPFDTTVNIFGSGGNIGNDTANTINPLNAATGRLTTGQINTIASANSSTVYNDAYQYYINLGYTPEDADAKARTDVTNSQQEIAGYVQAQEGGSANTAAAIGLSGIVITVLIIVLAYLAIEYKVFKRLTP